MRSRRRLLVGAVAASTGLGGCSAFRRDQQISGTRSSPPTEHVKNPNGEMVFTGEGQTKTVVAEADWQSTLTFADGVPDSQVRAAAEFLEATDFSDASVYVTVGLFEDCRRYHIQEVSWTSTSIELTGCSTWRPPDERCEADTYVPGATLIRIPAQLDPDTVSSEGFSSGRCSDLEPDLEGVEADAEGDEE